MLYHQQNTFLLAFISTYLASRSLSFASTSIMRSLSHLLPVVALALKDSVRAATVATSLSVVNADLAPDGYTRS